MRVAIAIVLALVAVAMATPDKYASMFHNFKLQHGRVYATPAEEAKRFHIFVANMKNAEKLHRLNPLAVFGANEFADMTPKEFKVRHSAEKFFAARMGAHADVVVPSKEEVRAAAGQAIDWRTKGAVTYVKNQGQCGSCWAFSSTGSIEGQWFLAGNTLTAVSEQEFVSCDTTDDGCNGGLMDNAWGWLVANEKGQIATETSYPYVSGDGIAPACNLNGIVIGATISGYKNVQKTESAMGAWVYANGPMSVAVDATSWQTYTGGIMTNCISSQIDHGVLVVGFDDNNNPPYWIIKNSWGASWGENGYIRVQKGTDQCLITSYPCSSTVAGGPKPTTSPAPGPSPTTPAPGGKTFTQLTCSDDKCKNCTSDVLPQNQCIKGAGASFKAACITDGLLVTAYASADCSGSSSQTVNPINQCSVIFDKDKATKFVENICGSAPGPSPTTPAPNAGSFIQMQCTDSACSQGCQNNTFALNTCLQLSDGGSATAACSATSLTLTEYPLSNSCTGFSIPDQMPLNQCLQDEDGTYFENFCTTGSGIAKLSGLKKLKKH